MGLNNMSDRLFVPLNKYWYNLFAEGKKKWEIRGLNNRFNLNTVKVGREVELRKGYRTNGALWGKIERVFVTDSVYDVPPEVKNELFPEPLEPQQREEIRHYNAKYTKFIVFKVRVD